MAGAQRTTSRSVVLFLMGMGLWTFFVPIVTADTPVRGRSQWAPLDLLVARADQWRPVPHVHLVLCQIASIYVLMALVILALALPSPHKLLKLIAVIGSASSISLFGTRGPRAFSWLFYGRYTSSRMFNGDLIWRGWEGLHFTSGYYILISVMPLLAIALVSSERQARGLRGSGQPEPSAETDVTQR